MERASRLFLSLEALPASLLLHFGAIITVNKGLLDKNTAITRQLIRTARTLEAEDESSTGRVWAARFHHVTAFSRLARVLKLMKRLFL